jgi:hypothetical protein
MSEAFDKALANIVGDRRVERGDGIGGQSGTSGGEDGVRSFLEIFKAKITRALTLMGCPSMDALDRAWLVPAR